LQKEFVLLGVFIAVFAISTVPVYADSVQVNITNSNSAKQCPYTPSCFLPYQVTVSVGGTITWINLDNKTHTVTTGTTNYGPVGNFDSGTIEPGKSFTQFFGITGKHPYFDKSTPWVTGLILVENGNPNHAELAWVNDSLNIFDQFGNTIIPIPGKPITITKDVYNSGGTNATSIMFRLKITNSTNFLVYGNMVDANIGTKQTVPITFNWLPEKPGSYKLFFDADPSNTIGDTNENNDIAFDSLIVFNGTSSKIKENTQFNYNATLVPEFGNLASIVLAASIISIIVLSSKRMINRGIFARY